MGVGGQLHAPAALPPKKRPGTHCIGVWVGPRAGLNSCEKSRPPPGFAPQTVQPVASRYPGPQQIQFRNLLPSVPHFKNTSIWN